MSESSYAEVVASGPPQSEEEARANPVPEIMPTDQSVESLIDVNHGVTVVPSDFKEQEVKTETQAARLEGEAEAAEEAREQKEVEENRSSNKKPKSEKKSDAWKNPDVITKANSVLVAVVSLALGVGIYRKHQAGQLTSKVAGLWGLGLATFAAGDFFLSKFLYKKYPFGKK